MPETLHDSTPEVRKNDEASEARRVADAPLLGAVALLSPDTVRSFYGADDYYLGRGLGEDTVRSIIKKTDGTTEVVANGEGVHDSLSNTLEAMRTLETIDTTPIVRFAVDGSKVSLTELGHYTPKVAPSLESYVVPSHLEGVLKSDSAGADTYRHTVEQPGWEQELFAQIGEYVAQNESIAELADGLKVSSLSSLTPEQAVKLSLGIVQSISKYSWLERDGKRVAGGKREDNMTTMELLAEGLAQSGNPEWKGNGVCRNVASNVKAVFEALKANQNQLSMLRNTYAVFESGNEGYGTRSRGDASKFSLNAGGHAWNTFVTVGSNGESSITTVDATWAMGRNADGSLKEPDYTSERMFETIAAISENTEDKTDIALAMSDYLNKLTRIIPGETSEAREQRQQFALTEWLKVAPTLLKADMPSVPMGVIGAAYRLGANLDKSELQTLFSVQQAGWIDNFDAILGKYITGKSHLSTVDRLTVRDDNLQRAIYEKVGAVDTLAYADKSAEFRIRLRETQPNLLPEFDPVNNPADKAELLSLFKDAGLFMAGNRYYGDVVRNRLLQAARGNQVVFDSVVGNVSDYDLLRQYRDVRLKLTKAQQAMA